MIELIDVHSSFDGRKILQGVSFNAPAGQITGLMGPSGSGKSTILRLVMGFWQPDSGKILVAGEDIVGLGEEKLRKVRQKMGLVFQHNALFDSMTVAQNVGFYPQYVERQPWRKVLPRVMELLVELGLDEHAGKLPSELSGGMRRRVALARALIYKPDILLYDEPTTGLDPRMTKVVIELIQEMNERYNVTSVIVSHDLPSVYEICDHIVLLDNGRAVVVGEPQQLFSSRDEIVSGFTAGWRAQIEAYASQLNLQHESPGRD